MNNTVRGQPEFRSSLIVHHSSIITSVFLCVQETNLASQGMNIEQAIRGHWVGYEALTVRVPVARLWTGVAPPEAESPFVVLDVVRVEPRTATSSGRAIEHVQLRFAIHSGEHATAAEIAREIARRFERASLALDEGSVLDMRRERQEQRRGDDGVWTVAVDYLAITEHFPQGD